MAELIFKFGVKKRTIERDIERLRDEMGAPIKYDYKVKKYHYSDPTFSITSVILTEGDLFTVSTVLPLMEQYENTPLENSFRNMMSKITDMLPDEITVDSSFLNKDITFLKDTAPVVKEEVFNLIFKAIKSRQTIICEYKGSRSKIYKKKKFNAYHVLCQKGKWYAIGYDYDHKDDEARVLLLSRINKINLLSEIFKIPEDFKIENHIDPEFGIWNNKNRTEEYQLLFSSEMENYMTERYWHKDQQMEINEDGSVSLKFKSNQKEMIKSWIMGFGSSVTVIKPDFLREEIKSECIKMLEKY